LVDLRDFGTLITNKKFRNAICLYGWVWALPALEWFGGLCSYSFTVFHEIIFK
jgi:hypothetical protein